MSEKSIKKDKLREILVNTGILQIEIADHLEMLRTMLLEKRDKIISKSEKRKNN